MILNPTNLSKSSSQSIIIGDLGSDSKNISLATFTVKGSGSEEGILQFAHEKLKGKEIVDEKVTNLGGGKFEYTARYKSENGI